MEDLEAGWADGVLDVDDQSNRYGKKLSISGLNWLISQFGEYYGSDLPKPYLYPAPEGGVQGDQIVPYTLDLFDLAFAYTGLFQ